MKFARLAAVLLGFTCASVALAHTHLVRSDPQNGSTLNVAPTKFVLTFAEPVKLTALTLQKDADPSQKLGPLPPAAAAEVSVPAPKLVAGKYVLSWRAISSDGHVMPGKVTFTVGAAPNAAAAGATGS